MYPFWLYTHRSSRKNKYHQYIPGEEEFGGTGKFLFGCFLMGVLYIVAMLALAYFVGGGR